MKSPDETKKWLTAPIPVHYHHGDREPHLTPLAMVDLEGLHSNALSLIQQLEADNAKKDETIQMLKDGNASLMRMIDEECVKTVTLEAERDAAVACIPRECGYCKHDGTADFDVDSVCDYCLNGNTRWEWRGVQKEE